MVAWIGLALLAGSWLFGISFYHPATGPAWFAALVAGSWLVRGALVRLPQRSEIALGLGLLIPAVLWGPSLARPAVWCMALGLTVALLPQSRRWLRSVASAALAGGVILLAQSLAIALYAWHTARTHELPPLLASLLAAVTQLLGIDAVVDKGELALHSMRQVHHLGCTWDLLLDPATLCFFVGGAVMLALGVWGRPPAPSRDCPDFRVRENGTVPFDARWRIWLAAVGRMALVLAFWLPLRAGLVIALMLHRELRSDVDAPLHVMNHFLSGWMLLAMLAVPVLLCWRLMRLPQSDAAEEACASVGPPGTGDVPAGGVLQRLTGRPAQALALCLLTGALATAAVDWVPVGSPKGGRVMFCEKHSPWEPTTRPYDTAWYGEPSGYNYAAVYNYASHFFHMSRLLESDPINDEKLSQCDVLIVKTPSARFTSEEIAAIVRFVEEGGGLVLMGEHTNFERSSTYMNDISRHFGFTFRHDLLFGMDIAYDQTYVPAAVPHPIAQNVRQLDFSVSCSIEPGWSHGRSAILSTALWNLPPNYNMDNFFPIPLHRGEMRYGAFVQMWAAWHGKGRVVAFTDSTIFSNFCVFEPGKAELFLGMLRWLNGRALVNDPRPWLLLLSGLCLAGAIVLARRQAVAWLPLLAAGVCGFALAGVAVAAVHRSQMRPLPPRDSGPRLFQVVIDRTVSSAGLTKGGFPQPGGQGYGMIEQWIPRLGCFSARRSGSEAFTGDLLVVICPSRAVSDQYRDGLIRYVRDGGRLLVLDAPENANSTANSLLWPFGMAMHHERLWKGPMSVSGMVAAVPVEQACEVSGGQPLLRVMDKPVAARAEFGKGHVLAVGFASLFDDDALGGSWNVEADEALLARYSLLFGVVRAVTDSAPAIEARAIAMEKKTEPTSGPRDTPALRKVAK